MALLSNDVRGAERLCCGLVRPLMRPLCVRGASVGAPAFAGGSRKLGSADTVWQRSAFYCSTCPAAMSSSDLPRVGTPMMSTASAPISSTRVVAPKTPPKPSRG